MLNFQISRIDFKKLFLFSIICHFIAVFFSEGFHRPDEHLGVINMMGYKLGIIPESELSWEFKAQIRTWLQPYIYFCIAKVIYLFTDNPYFLAFMLRLFSSTLGIYSLYHLSKKASLFLKNELSIKFFQVLLFCFWFFPFFQARTTTENFSTSFSILAFISLANILKTENLAFSLKQSIVVSFFIALAFIFRFQSAFLFVFPLLYLFKLNKIGIKYFVSIILFLCIFVGLNIPIDYLGHNSWSFTPWNYFYQNLILKVASGFGVSPWYYYVTKVFMEAGPPLGLILVIGPMYFLFLKPFDMTNLAIWPFVIVHSLIGHKELRFIYPALPFAILAMAQVFDLKFDLIKQYWEKRIIRFFVALAVFVNFVLLTVSIFRPAYAPINMYHYIYDSTEEINNVYTLGVFRDQLRFYLKRPFTQTVVNLEQSLEILNSLNNEKTIWLLTDKLNERNEILKNQKCSEVYSNYPNWAYRFDHFGWMKRSKIWSLIRCR